MMKPVYGTYEVNIANYGAAAVISMYECLYFLFCILFIINLPREKIFDALLG